MMNQTASNVINNVFFWVVSNVGCGQKCGNLILKRVMTSFDFNCGVLNENY